jgi:hypothetical protein
MAKTTGKINTISEGADVVQVTLDVAPKVEEEVIQEEKPAEDTIIDVTNEVVTERKVKIKTKTSFKQYIGNTWYYFVAGEVISVPVNVKDVLLRQGALEVIG